MSLRTASRIASLGSQGKIPDKPKKRSIKDYLKEQAGSGEEYGLTERESREALGNVPFFTNIEGEYGGDAFYYEEKPFTQETEKELATPGTGFEASERMPYNPPEDPKERDEYTEQFVARRKAADLPQKPTDQQLAEKKPSAYDLPREDVHKKIVESIGDYPHARDIVAETEKAKVGFTNPDGTKVPGIEEKTFYRLRETNGYDYKIYKAGRYSEETTKLFNKVLAPALDKEITLFEKEGESAKKADMAKYDKLMSLYDKKQIDKSRTKEFQRKERKDFLDSLEKIEKQEAKKTIEKEEKDLRVGVAKAAGKGIDIKFTNEGIESSISQGQRKELDKIMKKQRFRVSYGGFDEDSETYSIKDIIPESYFEKQKVKPETAKGMKPERKKPETAQDYIDVRTNVKKLVSRKNKNKMPEREFLSLLVAVLGQEGVDEYNRLKESGRDKTSQAVADESKNSKLNIGY